MNTIICSLLRGTMLWFLLCLGHLNVSATEKEINFPKPTQHSERTNTGSGKSLIKRLDEAKSIEDPTQRNVAFQSLIVEYRRIAQLPSITKKDKFRNLSYIGYAFYAKAGANQGLPGEKDDYKQAFENFVIAYNFYQISTQHSPSTIPFVPSIFVNFHGFLGRAYYKFGSLSSDIDEKGW